MNYILIFLLLVNITVLILFALDKYLAMTDRYRISEKTLILMTLAGGSIGAITAQRLFRHKTQKFKYRLWIILFIHLTAGWYVWITLYA
ncbi:DUF1294 domain-containing protein [Sulfuricurvum sp.]|uniref:DUF1294 domain-containing protein n=1 Tax=Sulfuricurvum sp. TaxID=2025608 RepID=UPI003BB11C8F